MILAKLHSFDEAERDLTSADALEPNDPRIMLQRALVRLDAGKISEAQTDAAAVVASRPSDITARQILAVARVKSGEYEAAIADLTAILGQPGDRPRMPLIGGDFLNFYLQRSLAFTRTGKAYEADLDLQTIFSQGEVRPILQLQLYFRSQGWLKLAVDGKRSPLLDEAMRGCFINDACARGLAISD
jgi:tetratricopeptide (TPR) repeat protein